MSPNPQFYAPHELTLVEWAQRREYQIRQRQFYNEIDVLRSARDQFHQDTLEEIADGRMDNQSRLERNEAYSEAKLGKIMAGVDLSPDIRREIIFPFGSITYKFSRSQTAMGHPPINSMEQLQTYLQRGLPYDVSILWDLGKKIPNWQSSDVSSKSIKDIAIAQGYLHMNNLPSKPNFEASMNFWSEKAERNCRRNMMLRILMAASTWGREDPGYSIEFATSAIPEENIQSALRTIDAYIICPAWLEERWQENMGLPGIAPGSQTPHA